MINDSQFGAIGGRLGYQLRRADLLAMRAASAALAPLGVTPARATAVLYIAHHEGCDQMALGRALEINRASTMKAVNELVALGAVERRPGRNRRSNALWLTAAGRDLRHAIERATAAADRKVFAVLDASEQAQLGRLLAKVRGGIPAERAAPVSPVLLRRVK